MKLSILALSFLMAGMQGTFAQTIQPSATTPAPTKAQQDIIDLSKQNRAAGAVAVDGRQKRG